MATVLWGRDKTIGLKEVKEKKITVTIKDKHLDALGDLFYCELTNEQKIKYTKQAKRLWKVLNKAYDKRNEPYL